MIFAPDVIKTDVVIATLVVLNIAVAALPHVSLCVRVCLLPRRPGSCEAEVSGSAGHLGHTRTVGRKIRHTHLVQVPQIQAAVGVRTWCDRRPTRGQHVHDLPQSEPTCFGHPLPVRDIAHTQFRAFRAGTLHGSHPQQSWTYRSTQHEADVEPPGVGPHHNSQYDESVQDGSPVSAALG
jgi:hypothetical protein